ncbi:hypothetical protein [Rhodococcus pyridinivorans]|uniref:hypothetical protein n=1 Tax=Rhodococcus pyridinivorans TaxID=103816 RepID=UPI00200AB152|nr:hypothetical protein [Rhodococcus pyridinivorans]UPW03057.1 hypothetical protein M1C57_15375 [Rhodococcus pyridinivorans]
MTRRRLQTALAAVGILAVLGLLAMPGSLGSTMAAWSDKVLGTSVFSTSTAANKAYARAVSTYGSIDRLVTAPSTFGPVRSFTTNNSSIRFSDSGWTEGRDSGLLGLVTAGGRGRSCSRSEIASPNECASSAPAPAPRSYADSRATDLQVNVLGGLGTLMSSGAGEIVATAACRPGQTGVATLTGNAFTVRGTPLAIPAANTEQSVTVRPTLSAFRYTGTLRHVRIQEHNRASSQLWLRATSVGALTGTLEWQVDMLVASAECGLFRDPSPEPGFPTSGIAMTTGLLAARLVEPPTTAEDGCPETAPTEPDPKSASSDSESTTPPSEPLSPAPAVLPIPAPEIDPAVESDATLTQPCTTPGPTVLDALPGPQEPTSTGTDEGQDPPVIVDESDRADDARPKTTAPTTPEDTPTDTAPDAPDSPTTETPTTSTPADMATPTPTESSPAASAPAAGPTQPVEVGLGTAFGVLAEDGTDLGTATITDVRTDPGCATAVHLQVTTSPTTGPTRWASLNRSDLQEILADGTVAPVDAPAGHCVIPGPAVASVLDPDSTSSGWILLAPVSPGSRLMLRPPATAGWIFPVPAPATPPVSTTSTVPAPPDPSSAADDPDSVPAPSNSDPTPAEADDDPEAVPQPHAPTDSSDPTTGPR